MKKLLFFTFCLFSITLSAQIRYAKPAESNYQSAPPLTMEQMQLIAKSRAIERANSHKQFLQYVDKSSEYIKAGKWDYALKYIERAEQTNYFNNRLYYNKGIVYFNLKKKGKLKKVIRKANKNYYFDVVELLTIKLNSL